MSLDISYSGGVFSAPQAKSVGTVTAGTGPYNLASASYDSVSFDVNTQQVSVEGLFFKDDGLSMYIIGTNPDAIHQYTLSTAWDVSTASYANKLLGFGVQEGAPQSFNFKSDGTSIYYIGTSNDTVYQYDLSTAWDVSTGSYANKSMSVTTQENTPKGMHFKPDGTKVYIVGLTNDTVYQYSLSTAWDISTGSYESKSFSVSSQTGNPEGIFFNPNGYKMYVIGNVYPNADVFEYDLSTAWDVSTASYSNTSFSTASEGFYPTDIFFKSDGTKMYISEENNNKIYQYSTGTATTLDLSTGNYFSHTPSVNTVFAFSNPPASGTAAGFALALTGANVAETYDIANASYDSVSFSVATQETVPTGVGFKDDGTKMYIVGSSNDNIYQYSLSTAWDVSTASYDSVSLSVATQETIPEALFFKSDGTSLYIVGRDSNSVFQYDLTTAWDISTGSYASKSMSVSSQETAPRGLYFKDDGTKAYIVGTANDTVYQYALSTAWDISTGSFETGKEVSVASQATVPTGLFFSSNGYKMYVLHFSSVVYQYSLSTAWDVSTASYDSVSFTGNSQDGFGNDIYFKSDGVKMYILGNSNDTIYQYSTGSTAAATFTYPSSVKFPSGIAPAGPAIDETDVLVFYTDDGGTTYQGFRAGDAMA
jgi:6-phosphogluconolactonase (cycloisomerase 2 family)